MRRFFNRQLSFPRAVTEGLGMIALLFLIAYLFVPPPPHAKADTFHNVSVCPGGTCTTGGSGGTTSSSTNTLTQVFPQTAGRQGCIIQNNDSVLEYLYFGNATAAPVPSANNTGLALEPADTAGAAVKQFFCAQANGSVITDGIWIASGTASKVYGAISW